MMESIQLAAHAKINWSLDVKGKVESGEHQGYHLVEMVMQSIDLADSIYLQKSREDEIICSGALPQDSSNLALRAWLLLKDRLGLQQSLRIEIIKKIPVAAGLAGGSSDAAAVLKGVNTLLDLQFTEKQLAELALSLGADVPFCLYGRPAIARGIGEELTHLPDLPQQHLVLVNPGFDVPTATVYRSFVMDKEQNHPHTQRLVLALQRGNTREIPKYMVNVLESVTLLQYPQVQQIKDDLTACGLFAMMSGSGPSVFGLAKDEAHAKEAVDQLKSKWPVVLAVRTIN